jgi:hypothetical protein
VSALLIAAAAPVYADDAQRAVAVVTASNEATNRLLVYSVSGTLLETVPTQGQGGAGGNAGGVAASGDRVAVVNYVSKSVSIFARQGNGFQVKEVVPVASNPVSVAFANDHLYVLGTTDVESHPIFGSHVSSGPDGVAALLRADGTAAQVGVAANQLVITEKSGAIETVGLRSDGSVAGPASLVQNIPAGADTPFGLVTRGNNAYVTIAHSDEISLVRNGAVLTVTPSGTQHAPCWLALAGPFLFSSNSPSHSVSRYAVYGQKIVQDAAVAAALNGSPTDIAVRHGVLAVVDGSGNLSHVSTFRVDEDGNLALIGTATVGAPANGIAIIEGDR